MKITVMSMSADSARTGSWAICTSSTTASPVTIGSGWATMATNATRIRRVDVDAFVLAHRATWDRLEHLVKRRRTLTGAEVDELVDLYQRVSTHLSMVRSRVARLGAGRPAVGAGRPGARRRSPARTPRCGVSSPGSGRCPSRWSPTRSWRWWLGSAVAFFVVAVAIGVWVAGNPEVQATIGTPTDIDAAGQPRLRRRTTARTRPASFALRVWVNNSWVAAQCIGFAILLGLPDPVRAVPERRQRRRRRAA